jgi:tetratricopeptide (TPR) repeat protein
MKPKAQRKPQKKISRSVTIKFIDEEIVRLKINASVENHISSLRKLTEVRKKAKSIGYKEGIVDTYLASAVINWIGNGVNEVVKDDYIKALQLAEKFSYRKGIAYAKMGVVRARYSTGADSSESISVASELLLIARKDNDQNLEWGALKFLSNIFCALGEISRGYSLFEEALVIAEKRGVVRDIVSTICDGAGSILAPALYEKHLRKAVELAEDIDIKAHALIKYIGVLLYLERFDECELHIAQVRELLAGLPPVTEGEIRISIGSYYLDRGFESRAEEEFQRALELGMNPRGALFVNTELGRIYAKTDPQKALRYFEEGLRFSNQYSNYVEANRIHGYLADLYSLTGELEKASQQYALYKTITEENITKEVKQRAEYAEMILRFDQSQKHEKQLEEEVEEKSAALASKAMLLAEQTELLSNFRNDLRAILRKVEVNDPAINEIRKKLRELPEAVNWREFDEQFQSVHPGFQTMLMENYPSLSKMEIKNCVLLRLGLNSLDISKLLSLSKRTTEWHRHNIRRKLGIKPEADVAQFMQRM